MPKKQPKQTETDDIEQAIDALFDYALALLTYRRQGTPVAAQEALDKQRLHVIGLWEKLLRPF